MIEEKPTPKDVKEFVEKHLTMRGVALLGMIYNAGNKEDSMKVLGDAVDNLLEGLSEEELRHKTLACVKFTSELAGKDFEEVMRESIKK